MSKKSLLFFLILFGGIECLGNALHYFISGELYINSDLRNYAVGGQIIFALAVIAYGIWYHKTPVKTSD